MNYIGAVLLIVVVVYALVEIDIRRRENAGKTGRLK